MISHRDARVTAAKTLTNHVAAPISDRQESLTIGGPLTSASTSASFSQYCSILEESIYLSSDSAEDDYDDEDISVAIMRSLMDEKPTTLTTAELFNSLNTAKSDSTTISIFNICRTRIWDGAVRGLKRKTFDPANRISVKFTDSIGQTEGAIDVNGPRREFFSLVLDHIKNSNLFEGPPTQRVLAMNGTAMANDNYFYAGQLIAMSLVHGGPSPTFFSNTLYEAIAYGYNRSTAGLDDVGDLEIQSKLMKIQSSTSVESLQSAVDEAEDFLSLAGVMLSGLETLCVLQIVRENPVACRKCFLHIEVPAITAETLRDVFFVAYSERGSNKRAKEEVTAAFWYDYLLDIEEGTVQSTLADVLAFSSGTTSIPITTFSELPTINFSHSDEKFPTANTCSVVLRLPTSHSDYIKFKEAMDFGILNSQSFGTA
ncbi:G2/M phase-specific E3 ubiquitin-protein ligase-like [Antedon mediterranea]|uniref:G2/M phase-specific E3 ubiquitin-protein ligase-like n=1 Tax=Antedon mediterranea TaxID=105859 RepID=UPI003AF77D96